MIIRVQSDTGTQRLQISESDSLSNLYKLAANEFNLRNGECWCLSKSHSFDDAFERKSKTLIKSVNLRHGDIIFLLTKPSAENLERNSTSPMLPLEEEVDVILNSMDGRIPRPKNDQFCHHPDSGRCIHCVPLEPYDAEYLSHCDPPVKSLSFHAYLRKLCGGQSKGKFARLENLDCTVRPGCMDHPPWPNGICTKCQPKPVTLETQAYRHVDYVQFQNGEMMETFLDYWRSTGCQRIGLLLGRYAPFDTPGAPPLAIKAVVAAIYEPPQESTSKSVKLLSSLSELVPPPVNASIEALGLKPIGWIFTDLTAMDSSQGSVLHYRGSVDTYFMSAQECITAAALQNLHPNVSRFSADGYFGSKFVTVVVTGGVDKQIHFEAYQVSNVAMALQRADILVPTYDAPELGFIKNTSKKQFVPDVFYSMKDKYGNTVTQIGRPLPVEYLLVDMPAAFPIEPTFTFAKQSLPPDRRFPIENRDALGQAQTFENFAAYLQEYKSNGHLGNLRTCLSNLHVLAWLSTQSELPLATGLEFSSRGGLAGLLAAVRHDSLRGNLGPESDSAVVKWASSSSQWATLWTMADAFATGSAFGSPSGGFTSHDIGTGHDAGARPVSDTTGGSSTVESGSDCWACDHCTFHNELSRSECEICRLPRQI